jgi:hypothetical protein
MGLSGTDVSLKCGKYVSVPFPLPLMTTPDAADTQSNRIATQASTGRRAAAASPVGRPSAAVAASAAASGAEAEAEAEDEASATSMVTIQAQTVAARAMGWVVGQTARSCLCSKFWLQTYARLVMFGLWFCGDMLTNGYSYPGPLPTKTW